MSEVTGTAFTGFVLDLLQNISSGSQLLDANFNGGLRIPHYFNGRLLSAEDLKADQDGMLTQLNWVGQAAGYGIIDGLMVTQSGTTSVQITAGKGLNKEGNVIVLPNDITLPLNPTGSSTSVDDAGRFHNCNMPNNGGSSIANGVYLLTAIPASKLSGSVPLKGIGSGVGGCASKWEVEGIQFKLIPLNFTQGSGVTDQNFENLLANWCFGTKALQQLAVFPFTFPSKYTGLDLLSASDLTLCDLPLAVFRWDGSKLLFVDAWSARRKLAHHDVTTNWTAMLSDKRVTEGQARFLQFQNQANLLVTGGKATAVAAKDVFPFLPPVGFLPVTPRSVYDHLNNNVRRVAQNPSIQNTLIEAQFNSNKQYYSAAQKRVALQNTEMTTAPETLQLRDEVGTLRGQLSQLQQEFLRIKETPVATEGVASTIASTTPATSTTQQATQSKRKMARIQRRNQFYQQLSGGLVQMAAAGQNSGFDLSRFFTGLNVRIGLADRETVDFSLQRSWYDEAIDLGNAQRNTRIELYVIEDNLKSVQDQLYVMFVKSVRPVRWLH